MSERAAYSRVYWSIIDDPKFATVYDDDHRLATWLRLLLAADQAWPASANLPFGVRKASVAVLCSVGLIDVTGTRYRVRGLDAERQRRKEWATSRGASGDRKVTERSPNGVQTQGLRIDETRLDKTSNPPNPPQVGGSRANGTNPRSVAERAEEARQAELKAHRAAVADIRQRYYRGELTEAAMEALLEAARHDREGVSA